MMKSHILFGLLVVFTSIQPLFSQQMNLIEKLDEVEAMLGGDKVIQAEIALNKLSRQMEVCEDSMIVGRYYYLKAAVYYDTDRFAQTIRCMPRAVGYLRNLPNLECEYVQSLHALGTCYYELNMFNDARDIFFFAINEYENGKTTCRTISDICYDLGNVLLEEDKDTVKAAQAFELGQNLSKGLFSPEEEGAYQNALGSCELYLEKGNIDKAVSYIDGVISSLKETVPETNSTYLKLVNYKGNILFNHACYDKVIPVYLSLEEVLERNQMELPKELEYLYVRLASGYAKLSNEERALAYLHKVAQLSGKKSDQYLWSLDGIAMMYYFKGNMPACIRSFNEYIEITGESTVPLMVHYGLGCAYNNVGKNEEALQHLNLVKEKIRSGEAQGFKDPYGIFDFMANIYFNSQRYTEAYHLLCEAERYVNRNQPVAWLNWHVKKATTLRFMKRYQDAVAVLSPVVALYPSENEIKDQTVVFMLNEFGLDLMFAGRLDEALSTFQKEKRLYASLPMNDESFLSTINHNLGKCYMEMKDYKQAVAFLEVALQLAKKTNTVSEKTIKYLEFSKSQLK